jgi:hypothetical protein
MPIWHCSHTVPTALRMTLAYQVHPSVYQAPRERLAFEAIWTLPWKCRHTAPDTVPKTSTTRQENAHLGACDETHAHGLYLRRKDATTSPVLSHASHIYYSRAYAAMYSFMHRRRAIKPHFEPAFSNSTSASSCLNQRSLKTSSENLFALSRERRRIAKASDEGSSRALAKPSANCSSVEAWKPVIDRGISFVN